MSRYDNEEQSPRRESIMQQRLRAARGEPEPPDMPPPSSSRRYADDDDYAPQRGAPRYYEPGGGGGCATAALYLTIGAVLIVVLLLFAGNQLLGRVGGFFEGVSGVGNVVTAPTPTIVSRSVTIRQIQGLSRLETARYSIETLIEAGIEGNAFQNLLFGDQLLLIAAGDVTAGVDLSKLRDQDVVISGNQITITLPPSEIFNASLDESRTRVYDREQGWLAAPNQNLETQARQEAVNKILQSACEDGVMQRSSDEAKRSVERLVGLMDFEQVVVVSQPGQCVNPSLLVAPAEPVPATPFPISPVPVTPEP